MCLTGPNPAKIDRRFHGAEDPRNEHRAHSDASCAIQI